MTGGGRTLAAALLAGAISVVPYLGSLRFGPTYDDHHHVVRHPLLGPDGGVGRLLSPTFLDEAVPDQSRPTLLASLLIDRALFGDDFPRYHAQSLALHALAVALALLLLRRLGFAPIPAFAGALLFGLHPACTEAVASVSNREDLLVAAFGLAAILLARRGLIGRPAWLALAGLAFALALLAKELAVAVPLLFVVLAQHPRWLGRSVARGRWAALAACAVPGALVAGYLHLRLGFPALSAGAPTGGLALDAAPGAGWSEVPAVLGFRALRTLLGWPLSAEHDPAQLAAAGPAIAGALATAALLLAAALAARRRPAVFVGVAWFLVASLPTLAGPWLLNPVADRYLYLPALGALGVLGALLATCRGRAAPLLLTAALCVFAARTADRVQVWRSDVALFDDAVQRAPRSARAWQNLGAAHLREGDPGRAYIALARAVTLAPDRMAYHLTLATAQAQLGRRDEELMSLERAARLEAPLAEAPLRARAFHRWIRALLDAGQRARAEDAVRESLAGDPGFEPARGWARTLGLPVPAP